MLKYLLFLPLFLLGACDFTNSPITTNGNRAFTRDNTINVNSNDVLPEVVKNKGDIAVNKSDINRIKGINETTTAKDVEQDKYIVWGTKYIHHVGVPVQKSFIKKQFEKWGKSKSDIKSEDIIRINEWCSDSFTISVFRNECAEYNNKYRYLINRYLHITQ